MPFGKYRGQSLCALPDDYLDWLAGLPDLRPRLRDAVSAERARRQSSAGARTRGVPPPHICTELIAAGLRACARKYHPDLGGQHDVMIQYTAAADWLSAQARGLAC